MSGHEAKGDEGTVVDKERSGYASTIRKIMILTYNNG
jgi:hypothetical protein